MANGIRDGIIGEQCYKVTGMFWGALMLALQRADAETIFYSEFMAPLWLINPADFIIKFISELMCLSGIRG